jgi:hypothetical protein
MLVGKDHGLYAGYFEAFAAAHILAGHQVILAEHVRAGLGETSAIPFIGASCQLPFLGANNPGDFVLPRLMAVGAVQSGHLFFRPLIEKFSFFHDYSLSV